MDVVPAIARSIGWRRTNDSPSPISWRMDGRSWPGAGAGSRLFDAETDITDTTKLAASTAIAFAAPDELDEASGRARTDDLRHRGRPLELGVSLHQVGPPDEKRKVGLVGDVEEDGQDSGQERHSKELTDLEDPEGRGNGDRHRT